MFFAVPGQTMPNGTTTHAEHSFLQGRCNNPHTHPDLGFADCISITFECQKRVDKHDTVTQESSGDSALCPMRFTAGLAPCIWSYKWMNLSTWISTYICNSIIKYVKSMQVINALCNVVGAIRKTHLGVSKNKKGTHSIRSGADIAMYLGECRVYAIMLIGCWSSNVFLCYICKEVMEYSHNVSKKMLCFKPTSTFPTTTTEECRRTPEFTTTLTTPRQEETLVGTCHGMPGSLLSHNSIRISGLTPVSKPTTSPSITQE